VLPKLLKKKKYLSHTYSYDVDGEDLPKKRGKINKKALSISLSAALIALLLINYASASISNLLALFSQNESQSLLDMGESDWGQAFTISNVAQPVFNGGIYSMLLMAACLFALFAYSKLNYKSEDDISYGQKGDSRLTTIEEIQQQYKEIPNKEKSFPGVGGVPISHYKDKYYIDTDTVNTTFIGVSRSGKGEIGITTFIDILSRAEEKASMILNDPKGELYAGSKDTLEKRGYDVQVLNLQDPLQSMSYNPLQLVKDAWLQGNEQEAGKRANSIAYTLYNKPDAGENAWAYQGAQNAVTAIMIALVEYCVNNDCPEKITMANVAEMLNELGTLYYKENKDDFVEKNALDEFFKNLPQGHVAKKRYGSTSFSGEKARGTILSTANEGLQPFIDPLFAKMTSRNSVDLKQIGFSKYLNGQLNPDLMNKRIDISFHRDDDKKTVIGKHRIKVKAEGRYSLNFKDNLRDGDLVLIKYSDEISTYRLIYRINFEIKKDEHGQIVYQKKEGSEHLPEYNREVRLTKLLNEFPGDKQSLHMKYSEKPTAVFMIVPDYDSSNHTLASIFTKQLYTELAMNCVETKGNKCHKRVQFILDEFGNMPPIDDMDQVMTVCLGRNILFNLVIQSYSQIKRKYGDAAETIKENCQNHIYIMSTNDDTLEELSKKAGHTTIVGQSSNESHLEMDNKITKSADQVRILTPERLGQILEGETLVIRSLHRQDNNRRKVRPYPIFNTRETVMPYRYQFLSEWIDTSKELNEIDISSEHSNLNLKDLNVSFADFILDEKAKRRYMAINEERAAEEEKNEESKEESLINEIDTLIRSMPPTKEHKVLRGIIDDYRRGKSLPDNEVLIKISSGIEGNEKLVSKIREYTMIRES